MCDFSLIENDKEAYKAYLRVLKRLAMRDYTSFEIEEFLLSKFELSSEVIECILIQLKEKKVIDDERYFLDSIDYQRNQLRGNMRIQKDLLKRGFDKNKIQIELENESFSEYKKRCKSRAERFLNRTHRGSFLQKKQKLKNHLYQQGFELEVINSTLFDLDDYYDQDEEYLSCLKDFNNAMSRNLRNNDEPQAKAKTIQQLINKGYKYQMIKKVMKETQNEN